MKKKSSTEKIDSKSAENEYAEVLQNPDFKNPPNEEEVLFIKSYTLEPSLDAVLWMHHKGEERKANKLFRINAKTHGVIDYAFAATLLITPSLIGLKNKLLFGLFGASTAGLAALTKDSLGIKPVLSLKTHRVMDIALLSGIAAAATSKEIRSHKRTLGFTLSLLALGLTTVLLTDWNSSSSNK
jgi:hypothetical protein